MVVKSVNIESDDDLSIELRAAGVEADPHRLQTPAAAITRGIHSSIKCLESLKLDGQAFIFYSAGGLVTDEQLFSDLAHVNPLRMDAGERQPIGYVRASVGTLVEAEKIALALLRVGVVTTYLHIGAYLSYSTRRTADNGWCVSFRGVHVYFTNDRNEEPVAFDLQIDGEGLIFVTSATLE